MQRRPDSRLIEQFTKPIDGLGQLYVFRDITETREREETRLRLEQIVATMKQGFATVSLPAGLVHDANPAFGRMHGFELDAVKGHPAQDLYGAAIQGNNKAFAEMRQTAERNRFWEGEVHCCRKDGSMFPAALRVNLHQGAEAQDFLSVIQVDVSEQKRLEAETQALQSKPPANAEARKSGRAGWGRSA